MTLTDWLDADRGRLTAMAAHFGLTQSAVSQWRGSGVPLARMKPVREFTGGAVSLEEMVPGPVCAYELIGAEGAPDPQPASSAVGG